MVVGLREVAREPGVSHDLEHTRSLGKKHSTNQYTHSGDIFLRFTPFLAVFYRATAVGPRHLRFNKHNMLKDSKPVAKSYLCKKGKIFKRAAAHWEPQQLGRKNLQQARLDRPALQRLYDTVTTFTTDMR